MVVVAEEFARDLGHPVHRLRTLDGVLGGQVVWGLRAKGADGAGSEDGTARLACYFEYIEETSYTDVPSQLGLDFCYGTQQGC